MADEHIHDCTGPDLTCACGFVFRVAPISILIEVFDKQTEVYSDAFNCDTLDGAVAGLERAVRAVALRVLQSRR